MALFSLGNAAINSMYHHTWTWAFLHPELALSQVTLNSEISLPSAPGIHSHFASRSPYQDPGQKLVSPSLKIRIKGEPSNSGL